MKLKGLVYITNYEGSNKLVYVNKILETLNCLDADLDIVIHTTDSLDGLIINNLNVEVRIKPKIFSNSIHAKGWQPEPEFIWLYRQEMITKVDDYDIFIHLEDDIDFNEKNYKQFIKYSFGKHKLDKYIIGNILVEYFNNKTVLPQFHKQYRGVGEIITLNGERFMKPKNLHQASLIMSQEQLKALISNGNFSTKVRELGSYNIKCTAMTEPYCSDILTKIVPVDTLSECLTEHLTAKYAKAKEAGDDYWKSCQYLEEIEKELIDNSNLNGWAISQELCDWIYNNLEKGKTILELGSGSGTKELTKKYKVYSIEHDSRWLNHAENSNYIHAPIVEYTGYKWYSLKVLEILKTIKYDMIIVDGPPSNIGRRGFIENLDIFDTSVTIIMDDTNRAPEETVCDKVSKILNKKVTTFKGYEKSFSVIK